MFIFQCKMFIFVENDKLMNELFTYSNKLIAEVNTDFLRYAYGKINWKNRFIGLVGPRGVGKTTMVLQYIKKNLPVEKTLYVTAEDFYFAKHRLIDLAKSFTQFGGTHLIIDEIHKYHDWSRELKLIYDYHPNLQVIFTGSSVLDIKKGSSDLSRRAVIYSMQGLSFREYLELFEQIKVATYSLEEILTHKVDASSIPFPLRLFKKYLKRGYYPFGLEEDISLKLQQVVNQTLENDVPIFAGMNVNTGRKLKELLGIIAKSVPFKPNMSKIASLLSISRNNISDYLYYMEEAGMVAQLKSDTNGIRALGKVDKLYLDNTNLIYALAKENQNIGNVRETFFLNQTRVNHAIENSKITDFKVASYEFEIGGKNKDASQISGATHGFIVKDEIEKGYLNVIPLWHFGLMY